MTESAPLRATPDAPVPAGGRAEWYEGAGGARLRAALFPAPGASRGAVVLSPGRTEPIEKYFETIETLRARGFTVLAHDWRGQGLSDRLLPDRMAGHAGRPEDFLIDYARLLAAFRDSLPKPWIALGHSMGGCLILLALASGQRGFSGAFLSAPMLAMRTGSVPVLLARCLSAVLSRTPWRGAMITRANGDERFETNIYTHDEARWRRNMAQMAAWPELTLGDPTWGWLEFAFRATRVLRAGPSLPRIDIPVTLLLAGEERLTDNAGARRVAARLKRGRLIEIPGADHERLQETDAVQAQVWTAFDDLVRTVDAQGA